MLSVYWACLFGGVLFALVTVIFGDILGDLFDGFTDALSADHLDFLSPVVIVGGITAFGGAGIMLTDLTPLSAAATAAMALIIALTLSALVYFLYVKHMKNAENSTTYSNTDLVGRMGTVTIPIPAAGCGEVLVRIGAGNTNYPAASTEGREFPAGSRVVVAEVKDGTVWVLDYQED